MDTRLLLDAPGQPTSKIQVAALGDFTHKSYGDFSLTEADIQDWKRNLEHLPGKRALIDLDHRADRQPRNTEAAGWITDVAMEDGIPTATVQWTPVGRKAIEESRYSFFSPTFGTFTNERGEKYDNTLIGGALTNRPHLTSMRSVSLASPERVEMADERYVYGDIYLLDVSQAERDLAVKEGNALKDGSYPVRNTGQLHAAAHLAATGHGDVQGARKLIKRRAKEMNVPLSSLPGFEDEDGSADSQRTMANELLTETTLKLLDLEDGGDIDPTKLEAAVTKLAEAATAPAPEAKQLEAVVAEKDAQIVTRETQVQALNQFAAEIKAENVERRFDEVFGKAVREGRTTMAQRDKFRNFFELDADGTTALLDDMPQVVRVTPSGWDNKRNHPDAMDLPANTVNGDPYVALKKHMLENNIPQDQFPRVLEQYLNGQVTL